MIVGKLIDQLVQGGALHGRPIEKLTWADVGAVRAPAATVATVEVVARDVVAGGIAEKLVAGGTTRRVRAHLDAGRTTVRRDRPHSYRGPAQRWIT